MCACVGLYAYLFVYECALRSDLLTSYKEANVSVSSIFCAGAHVNGRQLTQNQKSRAEKGTVRV
jgi:hypothetical protein